MDAVQRPRQPHARARLHIPLRAARGPRPAHARAVGVRRPLLSGGATLHRFLMVQAVVMQIILKKYIYI
jgi:hypothetical protein